MINREGLQLFNATCSCLTPEHTITLVVDEVHNIVWLDFRLNQFLPLKRRLIAAFRYILGFPGKEQYDCVLLTKTGAEHLQAGLELAKIVL